MLLFGCLPFGGEVFASLVELCVGLFVIEGVLGRLLLELVNLSSKLLVLLLSLLEFVSRLSSCFGVLKKSAGKRGKLARLF